MKRCSTCKIEKSLDQFRKDISRSDGIHCTCNECNKIIQRRWYQNNKVKAVKTATTYYNLNRTRIVARRKLDRINNPAKYKALNKKKYNPIKNKVNGWRKAGMKNMTMDRYNEMLIDQDYKCAICNTQQKVLKRKLNVDHDHKTGEVRGLLCDACNGGLGYLKDSIEVINNAKNYLICHAKKTIGEWISRP